MSLLVASLSNDEFPLQEALQKVEPDVRQEYEEIISEIDQILVSTDLVRARLRAMALRYGGKE